MARKGLISFSQPLLKAISENRLDVFDALLRYKSELFPLEPQDGLQVIEAAEKSSERAFVERLTALGVKKSKYRKSFQPDNPFIWLGEHRQ